MIEVSAATEYVRSGIRDYDARRMRGRSNGWEFVTGDSLDGRHVASIRVVVGEVGSSWRACSSPEIPTIAREGRLPGTWGMRDSSRSSRFNLDRWIASRSNGGSSAAPRLREG